MSVKTYHYILMSITLAFYCLAIDIGGQPSILEKQVEMDNEFPITNKTGPLCKETSLVNKQLFSDYQKLSHFSKSMKDNAVTPTDFREFFWDGLTRALDFYHSNNFIKQSSLDHIITEELYANPDLEHPIKRPETENIESSHAFGALNQFTGEWHGRWKAMKVHHRWLSVRETNEEIEEGFTLIGFQSCYTGDGFGWNYIVKEHKTIVVLGFVYHFDANGTISAKNPHYAFVNAEKQLTWVSDDHIYYEFVCTDSRCNLKKHYVITGAQYDKELEKPKPVSAFQAVYLSENAALPKFTYLSIGKLKPIKKVLFKKMMSVLKRVASY